MPDAGRRSSTPTGVTRSPNGRELRQPELIQPGWELRLPSPDGAASAETPEMVPADPQPLTEPSSEPERTPHASGEVGVSPASAAPAAWEAPTVDDASSGPALPENVWLPSGVGGVGSAGRNATSDPAASDIVTPSEFAAPRPPEAPTGDIGGRNSETSSARLLALGSAAMLSGGVLTLLAVRRRSRLRRARTRARLPDPAGRTAAVERALRAIDAGDRFARVDLAIRSATMALIEHGERVVAVLVAADGDVELIASGAAVLPAPWHGEAERWSLPATIPLELLAGDARRVGSPSPTLVQLGRDVAGRDVFVDLEALEAVEIGGPGEQADAVVAALAATLAGSVLAEVTTLVGVGVPDRAFLGHRLHVPAGDAQRAFEAAAEAIGSTARQPRSTFELRAQMTRGETWEPAVVLAGSAVGTIVPPRSRTGLAVVSASPIHGPSSRLAPDGDAWVLQPAGIRLVPVGISPSDIDAIAELVDVAEPRPAVAAEAVTSQARDGGLDDDLTLVPARDDTGDDTGVGSDAGVDVGASVGASVGVGASVDGTDLPVLDVARHPATAELPWSLMVRLLGPVDVVDRSGSSVSFERSKTLELVAWLVTHRERSTRGAARTALWELDVRDATFANVVSEARRSLARLVEPPESEEWVGRTMTASLPLHELVRSDADLLEHALVAARVQPPAQAIATLSPAVDRIIGVPFEATSYLWPDAEGITSNLVLLATSAATELAAHCLSIGDIDGVFRATARGLQVLPGHEELIGLRMRAHARVGDHAGVRQEWESYERVITADPWSDGEPSPKLVELRRELLHPSR